MAVSLQVTRVINQAVGCHYFPPGPQLPCYQFRCLVNRGTVVVDTVDYQILLSRLYTSFGISDTTLSCFQSYLTNRTSSVRIGRHCFSSVTCTTGVPQGSVLGPLLFTAYVSPIAGIAHLYSIDQQQYADDTQLFISLSPSHARTVVRECCKGDDESQWERGKFDPPPPKNPLTDGHQNLRT